MRERSALNDWLVNATNRHSLEFLVLASRGAGYSGRAGFCRFIATTPLSRTALEMNFKTAVARASQLWSATRRTGNQQKTIHSTSFHKT